MSCNFGRRQKDIADFALQVARGPLERLDQRRCHRGRRSLFDDHKFVHPRDQVLDQEADQPDRLPVGDSHHVRFLAEPTITSWAVSCWPVCVWINWAIWSALRRHPAQNVERGDRHLCRTSGGRCPCRRNRLDLDMLRFGVGGFGFGSALDLRPRLARTCAQVSSGVPLLWITDTGAGDLVGLRILHADAFQRFFAREAALHQPFELLFFGGIHHPDRVHLARPAGLRAA